MSKGRGLVAVQVGGWATFAEVRLTIEALDSVGPPAIRFDPGAYQGPIPHQWMIAISFGVVFAVEHLPLDLKEKGYVVVVDEIRDYPVDTNLSSVAMATILAVADALKTTLTSCPYVDRDHKVICFPK